ncbi:AMP-binding protein [Methylomonas sp. MgM2]
MSEIPNTNHPLGLIAGDQPFAIHDGNIISRGRLWSDVRKLAAQLPDRPYQFNLCENRYLFCICLLAAAARKQICLLPPSSQIAVIEEILRDYPDAYLAAEKPQPDQVECFEPKAPEMRNSASPPNFDWEASAITAFTSGSTGRPKPCTHSLKTFAISADMAVRALGLSKTRRAMISTTPPQHMYGLETSVFWPLFSDLVLYDVRPFFPEQIRQTIANSPFPAMLTTTPTHLRALIKAGGNWENLAGVISATDTLTERQARETAAILGQSPHEIYGSTETLSFARREQLRDRLWQPYSDVRISQSPAGQTQIESAHLPSEATLQDSIRIREDGRFEILGRDSDMVKIGGKRSSLSELNRRLLDVEGVEDGFCFLQHGGRVAAVVVSALDKQSIREKLRPFVDEVFLPRKIHIVDAIPRNATGKLSAAGLESLISGLSERV